MQARAKTSEGGLGQPAANARNTAPAVVAAVAAIVAAWISAGSTGLLTHPLRHALTWSVLGVAVVVVWPDWRRLAFVALAVVGMMALALVLPAGPVHYVLAVALVTAVLAQSQEGTGRRILGITAVAVTVFGLYRLACTSIPTVWLLADRLGCALGRVAGWITGEPLRVGTTFGGVDFLVLMSAVYAGWLCSTASPRTARAIYAAAAILGGHLLYLVVLSYSTDLLALLPDPVPPPQSDLYHPPDWNWADAVRKLVPWNVPILAVLIQAVVAGAMFRWASWPPAGQRHTTARYELAGWRQTLAEAGPLVLAVLLPIVTTLSLSTINLDGKKIVAYEQGYLNWLKPEYDQYGQQSAGMYGMLGELVSSLSGRLVISAELSESDLADADALVLIHPFGPWPQERLDRVEEFVRDGGSLLVAAEPAVMEDGLTSTFNDALRPTGLFVRHDTAVSETGGWQYACRALAHPATSGVDNRPDRFGMVAGSSIRTAWPARPVLIGRFGWSDPGSDAVMTGISRYEPGQRLGDLVLAAEQRLGKGKVFVLGDTASLTNLYVPRCYPFTGRLLGYLANNSSSPQTAWRQLAGLLVCVGLIGLLAWRSTADTVIKVAAPAAVSLALSTAVTFGITRVLPDGRDNQPNNLAYIDASHLEAYSDNLWVSDGIAGLTLTLMRSGYLPLLLPELTAERLDRAGMLILIAPARPFSETERKTVRNFVRAGGILICTVGAEQIDSSRSLLDEFDLAVPASPVGPNGTEREPEPGGHFRSRYLSEADTNGYDLFVCFNAAWPVEYATEDVEVITRDAADRPVAVVRRVGEGKVVLIGDTGFAMNKNLEFQTGEAIYGRYENAQFWRWLLGRLADAEEWIPPKPPDDSGAPEAPAPDDATRPDPDARDTPEDSPSREASQ